MAILSIQTDFAGQVGDVPRTIKILSNDTYAQVTAAGYINGPVNGVYVGPTDRIEMIYAYNASTGAGTYGSFVPSISSGVVTLLAQTGNGGNVVAGSNGVAGTLQSFPSTANKGSLIIAAVNNTGNTTTTLSNAAMGQASVITIPDPGAATGDFVLSQSAAPTNNVAFTKVMTIGFAALASAGKVNVQAHTSATSQFAVIDLKVLNSTGLSGGGGDRLLKLQDGTLVFNNAGITAALLGTPICTVWGGTGNPIANGTSQVSTAGADIYFQYSGGTLDYTAGSVEVAVTLVQTAA